MKSSRVRKTYNRGHSKIIFNSATKMNSLKVTLQFEVVLNFPKRNFDKTDKF